MKKIYLSLILALGLLSTLNAQTNVLSSGMSIQGIARDINNEALANIDQLDLVFTVYYLVGNSTTPTVILTRTATVKTDNFGVFSYVLTIDQDQYNIISTQSAYLKVGSGSVVFSDEKLQAVPYAIYAQNGSPTGTIVAYIGTVAPTGWLICDGTTIPSGAYYDNLKVLAGSNTPDLRGLFLRGTGNATSASGRGGSVLKTVQQDDFLTHRHDLGSSATVSTNGSHNHSNGDYDQLLKTDTRSTAMSTDTSNGEPNLYSSGTIQNAGAHSHTLSGSTNYSGGTETRPINYGVNYIIKI